MSFRKSGVHNRDCCIHETTRESSVALAQHRSVAHPFVDKARSALRRMPGVSVTFLGVPVDQFTKNEIIKILALSIKSGERVNNREGDGNDIT